jgi:hypothetical protein
MSAQLGGALQPGLERTASAIATTTSAFAGRVHPALSRTAAMSQSAAGLVSVLLLTPAAVTAFAFALWRLGEDLGWTGKFVVTEGLFSHWPVWMMLSIGLKMLATFANSLATEENRRPLHARNGRARPF